MQNNRQLTITTANTRKAVVWARNQIMVSELIQRLSTPIRSAETYDQYMRLPKAKQDELKDVGGYVAGALSGTRRKGNAMLSRSVITLDLDALPAGGTDEVLRRVDGLGCLAIVYSTRKHAPFAPRLRVLVVLDEDCTPEEYEPISRKLAEMIGIEWCDPTTFEVSRLMYWPSVSADAEYIFWWCDKPFLSRTGMLALYHDWHDVKSWPVVPGHEEKQRKKVEKAQNPTEKSGVPGAFCRAYSITEALEKFLPDTYTPTDTPGRYTYAGASSYGGAVVYDDLFMYSHHASDPICNQLVNAFDLVRLHKFGEQDDDVKPGTPVTSTPSYKAMRDFAMADAKVTEERSKALANSLTAAEAFGPPDAPVPDMSWVSKLALDKAGNPTPTLENFCLIVENDPDLNGSLAKDVFDQSWYVTGPLPWSREHDKGKWNSADDAHLYLHIEKRYHVFVQNKINIALEVTCDKNRFNSVENYLRSLQWDGQPRLDTVLVDYFGAPDNGYTRAVMRKTLCAAVARALSRDPKGVKFDYVPVLIGGQGIGKTTFLTALGKDWFTADVNTFDRKVAGEIINGMWIVELGELVAMNSADPESVKQFLSAKVDRYRAAYGHYAEDHIRRCVFIGTTNEGEFLRDKTGNRRFWPVDCKNPDFGAKKNPRNPDPADIDQIWAEAFFRWELGESLYLSREEEAYAVKAQADHEEDDTLFGEIVEYLEKPIPPNWYEIKDVYQRRSILNNGVGLDELAMKRDRVCAKEIFVDVLCGKPEDFRNGKAGDINKALDKLPGWERVSSIRFGGWLGQQRGYRKIKENTDEST